MTVIGKHNILIILLLLVSGWVGVIQADVSREYKIKAAYLINFARFVYWPDKLLVSQESFNICIIGKSPFGSSLDNLAEEIKHKKIKINYSKKSNLLGGCQIVYFGENTASTYIETINTMKSNWVLTVSDIKNFTGAGGMIGFIKVRDKVSFEINVKTSSQSNIKYRSQLLEIAERLR